MKKIIAIATTLFGLANVGFAQTGASNNVEITAAFINQLSEEMRTNHPALRAADANAAAAAANVRSTKIWDDPMARVGVMAAERMMRHDDGDLLYGLEQKLPLFGKPQAERRMARSELTVAESKADAKFQSLRRDFANALFQTALAQRAVEIMREEVVWLDALQQSTEQRYETGEANQFDVLKIQNERALRLDELTTEAQMLTQQRVTLNRFLNRSVESPWPDFRLPAVAAAISYSDRLVRLAIQNEPELRAMRDEIKTAESAISVARKERFPEVALGAESRNYSGSGEWRQAMFTVSMSLPWGNRGKYNAAIRREQEKLRATQLDAQDFELGLRSEVHELTIKIDAARRAALLYRDEILPRSQSALESAQFSWESGRGMFRDVLDARKMLLDAQMNHARAVTTQYQRMADLVLCCGLGDFEALQMIGALPETKENSR